MHEHDDHPKDTPINPGHKQVRGVLRVIGPIILLAGGLCMLIAFVDFVGVMTGRSDEPKLFWLFFVGGPLLFFGIVLTQMAFAGKVARYMSQESTPVGTDTFNYAAKHTRGGMQDIASAVGAGLRAGLDGDEPATICPKCKHENDDDAKFCSKCGTSIGKTKACPDCNEMNDHDARYCDNCGKRL